MINKWVDLTREKQVEILEYYHAHEEVDKKNVFQECARLRQSLWREKLGFKPVLYQGKLRGSRLAMPDTQDALSNFLTETIGDVVREELTSNSKGLINQERLLTNLLSSQALCFNLFGELKRDPDYLATTVFAELTDGRVKAVERIEFEYSPGRSDSKYTGDKSAFDVYVTYRSHNGKKGFVGIEMKYHENPYDQSKEQEHYNAHRGRYEEIARDMKCFLIEKLDIVRGKSIQQFWRDHLLAGAHRIADANYFDDAFFVCMYPDDNVDCKKAVAEYRECLVPNCTSFEDWTLEHFVKSLKRCSSADWIQSFSSRYLDFELLPTSVPSNH